MYFICPWIKALKRCMYAFHQLFVRVFKEHLSTTAQKKEALLVGRISSSLVLFLFYLRLGDYVFTPACCLCCLCAGLSKKKKKILMDFN